jgi:hypothetical protein
MSLLSYASPYNDNSNPSRKRVPTMRKTIKKPASSIGGDSSSMNTEYSSYSNDPEYTDEYVSEQAKYNLIHPATLDDGQDERSKKVNDLLNKITAVDGENSGSNLANFTPPPNPVVQVRGDPTIEPDEPISQLPNPLQIPKPVFQNNVSNRYLSRDPAQSSYSNYQNTYDPVNVSYRPNLYNPQTNPLASGDKMLEKINYMIHLLENLEAEKTANITEEFILYAFLGVFIIFIVDSFSRGGKYIK